MSASSAGFHAKFKEYQEDIEGAQNERERAQYFIDFLRSIPDLDDEISEKVGSPTDITPQLEQYLSTQRRQLDHQLSDFGGGADSAEGEESETVFVDVSGRLDARIGNLVIEFKDDLEADLEEAREQLRKHVYLLHEEGIQEDFLCLATDGEVFITYETLLSEDLTDETDIQLSELTRLYTDSAEVDQVKRWIETLFTKRVHPVVEELDAVFGVNSDAFGLCLDILEEAYEESQVASVHRQEWSDYLQYAQGESPDEEITLFLRHTYLASFAKLLSYMVFTRGSIPSIDDAKEVLSGEISAPFPENLFEEDLFAWVGRTAAGDEFVEILVDQLLKFNLGRVDQDIFKKLYQDMVSYEVRHDLGEYYTPDWLAEYLVRHKLDLEPDDRVLDPGCGSGSFLVEAIQFKRHESGKPADELVTSIAEEVIGIEIHPLAVMIAKANYVAAIRDLLPYRREEVQIPVYLADSVLFQEQLREPDVEAGVEVRGPIPIAEEEYYIPQKAIEQPGNLDTALDLMQEFLEDGSGFKWRLAQEIPDFEDVAPVFERIRENIAQAEQEGRDSIHTFILKNFYRPLYLSNSRSFDAVIGNPPWLTYNYIRSHHQQDQLKEMVSQYGLHPGAENVTNIDLATIFVVRCVDLYLKDGGSLGFVMPRGLFTSDQHDPFRRGGFSVEMSLETVLDLKDVKPLFNNEACAIVARKGGSWEYPVPKETLSGDLPMKNIDWDEAEEFLEIVDGELFLHGNGKTSWDEVPDLDRSEYHPLFYKGADITPRSIWFVELQEEANQYGFNASQPPIQTSKYGKDSPKNEDHQVRLKGKVKTDFLYASLISKDIVPFAHTDFRPVVLPVLQESSDHTLIDDEQASTGGYRGLESWLKDGIETWEKVDRRVESLFEEVNYRSKITRQDPSVQYKVLSLDSGTNIAACVVDTDTVDEGELNLQGFIADMKTYYFETANVDEAYYLSGVLNSGILNQSIKNLQSRGLFGERDIKKNPFEFPIPLYDEDNPDHRRLAELAQECEEKAYESMINAQEKYKATWRIREVVRDDLKEEIEEIDEIVERLFGSE